MMPGWPFLSVCFSFPPSVWSVISTSVTWPACTSFMKSVKGTTDGAGAARKAIRVSQRSITTTTTFVTVNQTCGDIFRFISSLPKAKTAPVFPGAVS